MDMLQAIVTREIPGRVLRYVVIGAVLLLSVLPAFLTSHPAQADCYGWITQTGTLIGGKSVAIPIELNRLEGLRCDVEPGSGRVSVAIHDPTGIPVQSFGQVYKVSYGFTATTSGRYHIVISNPSGINRVSYTLNYCVYGASSSAEASRTFFMHGFLVGGRTTAIYQPLNTSQKVQGEILVTRARVNAFYTNPAGGRSDFGSVSSHRSFEIPGQTEGRYTLVIENPSGLDSTIFRITYSIEPYTAPPPPPDPPPPSPPPPDPPPPGPQPPPPGSPNPDHQPLTPAQRNGLAFMAGVIFVVVLLVLIATRRNRRRYEVYYPEDFDDRSSARWDDYGADSGGEINVVHHFPRRCPDCRGRGRVERPMMPINRGGIGVPRRPMMECPRCDGTGEILS